MAFLHTILDSGHQRLKELGYKQELKRDLSALSNFAFSFSVIAVLMGVTTLYNTGLAYGGPISMTYGWLIAGVFTMVVALSMAEICSAYPISGGLYFWSYKLAGKEWGPFASWITGWFNILGQWAGTTSVDYSLAVLLQVIILLSTGGANGGGYLASKYTVLGFHGGILFLHAAINCLPVGWLSHFATFASAWNVIGKHYILSNSSLASLKNNCFNCRQMNVDLTSRDTCIKLINKYQFRVMYMLSTYPHRPFCIICGAKLLVSDAINCTTWISLIRNDFSGVFVLMILIPAVSPTTSTAKFVFQHFKRDNTYNIHSSPYIFLLGLLMSQYSLAGYDTSAHMSEETKSSDKNGPYGIISSVAISIVVGWAYILGITFAVTDLPHVLDPANDANGYAIAQVFYDAFKNRYGSGAGGIVCLSVVAVGTFFCGVGCITSNSRMTYAFSRDGAMPFSSVWHAVNKQDIPLNAVWLSAAISFIMALTSLGSLVAFQAMVSIATVGLYISYALPSLFRITLARQTFVPGPFHLGQFSLFAGWVAVLWVVTISILFSLPVQYPVTANNLNYTPIAIGGVLVLVIASWLVSARFWFRGPVPLIEHQTENLYQS